jgi:myo-inositol-1(or 4)-monophosphatase
MIADDLNADLALLRDAAREGGEIAMRHFRQEPETWLKAGSSPVTAADIAVDRFLFATLRATRLWLVVGRDGRQS